MNTLELQRTQPQHLESVLACERKYPAFVGEWTPEQHRASMEDEDAFHGVFLLEDRFAGFAILRGLKNPNRSVELMRIALDAPGNGLGAQALALVQRICFDEAGANRLWLDVREHNLRAQRSYERQGFVKEGLLREASYAQGEYHSLYIMSMLRREYLARARSQNS